MTPSQTENSAQDAAQQGTPQGTQQGAQQGTPAPRRTRSKAAPEPTFAEQLARARQIVQLLEQGDVDLEQGAKLYREACQCLKGCQDKLGRVRNEIELLNGEIMPAEDVLNREADAVPF